MRAKKNTPALRPLKILDHHGVTLSNGWSILTLLIRDAQKPRRTGQNPRSYILQRSPQNKYTPWRPGAIYTTAAIWYVDKADNLYGWDYRQPGHIYVCRRNGRHVADLQIRPARQTVLRPKYFQRRRQTIYWMDSRGHRRTTPFVGSPKVPHRRRPSVYH